MDFIKKVFFIVGCFLLVTSCNQNDDVLRFIIPEDYQGLVIIGFDDRFESDSCIIPKSGILMRTENSAQNNDIVIGYQDVNGKFFQVCDTKRAANTGECSNDKFIVSEINSTYSLNLCYYLDVDKSNNSDTCFYEVKHLKYLVISSNRDSVIGENLLRESDEKLTKYILETFKKRP